MALEYIYLKHYISLCLQAINWVFSVQIFLCLWRLLKMELERVVPTIFYLNNVMGNVLKKKQNEHQNRLFWKYKVNLFWFISWKHCLKIVSVLWQYAMHIHIILKLDFPVHTHTVVIDIGKGEIGNACKSTPSCHEKFNRFCWEREQKRSFPRYIFSSPGPKGHVRYCHHLVSVIRPLTFSHFNLLLWNNWAKWNQTWQKASM